MKLKVRFNASKGWLAAVQITASADASRHDPRAAHQSPIAPQRPFVFSASCPDRAGRPLSADVAKKAGARNSCLDLEP